MKKVILSVVIAAFLLSISFAATTIQVGDLSVSLYSKGWVDMSRQARSPKSFMDWSFSSIYNIEVETGYEYYIRIKNTSDFAVGVYAYVDGLNSIGREAGGGSWWYLSPYQSLDLKGWQLDDDFRANFEFVDLGAPSGQGGKYPGWIFISQYRVYIPRPVYYGYDEVSESEMAAPSPASAESRTKSAKKDGGAETGAGRVQPHDVTEVSYELESHPTGLAALKYSKKPAPPPPPPCYPYLGVDAQSNINDGVYVSRVYPRSPAAQASLKRGDVIRYFNGVRVRYFDELKRELNKCHGGQQVILEVVSTDDRRIYDVTVYIGCR